MPRWTVDLNRTSIVKDFQKGAASTGGGYSTIEQNGLHATLILFCNAECSSAGVQILFPTILVEPNDPRGYRSVNVPLPKPPQQPSQVTYDGNAIRFSAANFTLSLFASPSHPLVWCTIRYSDPQVAESKLNVIEQATVCNETPSVWKFTQWTSQTDVEIAFTVISKDQLPAAASELTERIRLTDMWTRAVRFECPSEEVTALCHFAKIRMNEAIFDAPNIGRVHSPGGGMFYSGVWCNDQAEYAAPILAMLGGPNSRARETALNCLEVISRWFDHGSDFVPYSIEIDGGYIGRLDRGDAAMYSWGASLTLLTIGDSNVTARLYPHIKFTTDILLVKISECWAGVVPSQSDELEGRYPTGDINLSVNCLSILALEAASEVALEVGNEHLAARYMSASQNLRANVDRYFCTSGERMYDYYKSCPDSRGWICLSALANLPKGKEALRYSLKNLWCNDGVLTSSDKTEVWDRCTLYAIRAALQHGSSQLGIQRLVEFARRTISGPAAPYARENNGGSDQLSAESGLVLRVITEGLLGLNVRHGGEIEVRPICVKEMPVYYVGGIYIRDVCLDFSVRSSTSGSELFLSVFCEDWKEDCCLMEGQKVKIRISDVKEGVRNTHVKGPKMRVL